MYYVGAWALKTGKSKGSIETVSYHKCKVHMRCQRRDKIK